MLNEKRHKLVFKKIICPHKKSIYFYIHTSHDHVCQNKSQQINFHHFYKDYTFREDGLLHVLFLHPSTGQATKCRRRCEFVHNAVMTAQCCHYCRCALYHCVLVLLFNKKKSNVLIAIPEKLTTFIKCLFISLSGNLVCR